MAKAANTRIINPRPPYRKRPVDVFCMTGAHFLNCVTLYDEK
jgi:hypothetical protein